MKRRALLGGIGIAALSGCIATLESTINSNSGPIESREFEVFEPGSDFYDSVPEHNPAVTFDQRENRVEIIGILCVGSSSTYKASLEKSTYHDDTDTVLVHVGRVQVQVGGTDDMSADAYRAEITFQKAVPHSVVAVELGQCAVESTTTHLPVDG